MYQNLKITYWLGFLFSISIALVSYINSSFLAQFIDKKYEGLVFSVASLIIIILMLKMPKFLAFFGNKIITLFLGIGTLFSLILLAYSNNLILALFSFLFFFIFHNLIIMNLDIFVENFSNEKNIGKLRGLYLTISNLGWVLSQVVSGQITEKFSFSGIYFFSSFFIFIFCLILFFSFKDFKNPQYTQLSFWKTGLKFLHKIDLSKIYFINFILKIFFSWMVIYTPIYLHQNLNLGWDTIGIIFAFMLTPFVFLSFPMGKWSDKIGEKEMLIFGFLVIILSTFFIPFLDGTKIWLIALVLFITRIGAATIEVMSESYFFKSSKKEDADELSFFRTTTPFAYIIGPVGATITLLLIPDFKYLFFILTLILIVGFIVSLKIKDTA